MKKRVIIAVMDSFGIGHTADAEKFGDIGANTLLSIANQCAAGDADNGRKGPLTLPNLSKLGLGKACEGAGGTFPPGLDEDAEITGAYGWAAEISSGKDTPSGHWEIAGVPVLFDWGYFPQEEPCFPQEFIDTLIERCNLPGILGNCHSSGTVIIERFGGEHMQTGKPICYTSADSVFQIAAHEETFGLEKLYEMCEVARELLNDLNIGRVIARPFIGKNTSDFNRTGNRRDFSVLPPEPTMLDKLAQSGGEVISIGKIADIYAHQGITQKFKATGLDALFDETLKQMELSGDRSLIFTNFVDFDQNFGHRRDVPGYAGALEHFDQRLPELLNQLEDGDLLLLTADHGCDPTWHGSDHTREHVPVLMFGKNVKPGSLGLRDTFADMGQTIAEYFDLEPMNYGKSFLKDLI
ncbi:phosphopentomutase [Algicola sagamiensis]|uniref:phosphopentomutase n=1 Tax=Algicola sagamiensis TaxID=163869 RepID=UPI00058B8B29|nr:phosphopentomutase [Algicola sagamiensis]